MHQHRATVAAIGLLLGGLDVGPALALEVSRSVEVRATPSEAWRTVGPFCAIEDWHPAIQECAQTERNGVVYRTLITADGGVIREQLLEHSDDAMAYSYQIVESELPVAEYVATLRVRPSGDAATIEWSAEFQPNGADEAAARALIDGIYRLGLDALEQRLRN
jgi:hypothetical protein